MWALHAMWQSGACVWCTHAPYASVVRAFRVHMHHIHYTRPLPIIVLPTSHGSYGTRLWAPSHPSSGCLVSCFEHLFKFLDVSRVLMDADQPACTHCLGYTSSGPGPRFPRPLAKAFCKSRILVQTPAQVSGCLSSWSEHSSKFLDVSCMLMYSDLLAHAQALHVDLSMCARVPLCIHAPSVCAPCSTH
ncbi:hypothetical protein PanWU01x14_116490 [Parasponia andersonii]|uniref:Uncharacterized protein n=1 Tax=Parasponia andersonii TaxID=3476 RepID=A0A2P5CWT4_PARAD|nr:hypothetical protein PanWU01x14_116490 [Parasponia andersonii]